MTQTKNNKRHFIASVSIYGIGGVICSAIHYALACFAFYVLATQPLISNAAAYIITSVVSFTWHKHLTFKSKVKTRTGYAKFIVVCVIGLSISQIVIWLCFHELHLHYLWSQALALAVVPPISYVLNHFWTFKHKN